ncbi:MAG: acyl--CoA ligase [Oligoflexales bacterium]|nr:acyl--CoA ligase [Oligoflexales bacterium]
MSVENRYYPEGQVTYASDNLFKSISIKCGGRLLDFDHFWSMVDLYSKQLGCECPRSKYPVRYLIQPDDRIIGLIQVFGCLVSKNIPLLDEKKLSAFDSDVRMAPPFELKQEHRGDPHEACQRFQNAMLGNDPALIFVTSGSTGDVKLVEKNWRQLSSEILLLKELYSRKRIGHVAILISPFHIYGFLHGILLPICLGANISMVENSEDLIYNFKNEIPSIDLLVCVPALWSLVKNLHREINISLMVTSGTAFGSERSKELAELSPKLEVVEILGSTETGGIGYRFFCDDAKTPFRLFPPHRLCEEGDKTRLFSPFLFPDESILLDDILEILDECRFFHHGRSDTLFKYSGRRYSLAEIERNLSVIIGHSNIFCIFDEKSCHPKGGEILAVVEQRSMFAIEDIRRDYVKRFSTPFPSRFAAVDRIRRDPNGKVERKHILDVLKI